MDKNNSKGLFNVLFTILFMEPSIDVTNSVYEPAEDTYLLAKYAKDLKGIIIEIGIGSGYVSLVNAKSNPQNKVFGVDLNPEAVENAKHNAIKNNISNVNFFVSDLFSSVRGMFDAIVFNPPYLPTEKKERVKGELNRAFDGGKDGRKILDVFLAGFGKHLKTKGTLLLVHSSLNNQDKTISILKNKGFKVEILEERSFFFEKLLLLKAARK